MNDIPGKVAVNGREFIYVEWAIEIHGDEMFEKITNFGDGDCIPTSGGVLEENAIIYIPNGKRFYGVSYKGDLNGWYKIIIKNCKKTGLQWGNIIDNSIKLSNGEVYLLDNCKIELS